jgi:hypothetical protein
MGKALVFAGLNVQNPLQILDFEEEDLDVTRIAECFANITSAQSAALKKLVKSLKVAGTFDKLSYLILPAMAGTVDEAIRNVMVDNDNIPDTTDMSLTSNLLYINTQVTVTNYIKPGLLNSRNLAMGVFVDGLAEWISGTYSSQQIAQVNTGYRFMRDNGNIGYVDGVETTHKKNYATTQLKIGMSTDIDNLNSVFIFAEDSVQTFELDSSAVVKATDTASVILSGFPYTEGSSKYWRTFGGGIKLLWVSSLLTEAELVATHKAFDEFITSLS